MEIQQKTPVEVIQELIAIHTTRKEAYLKLQQNEAGKSLKENGDGVISQSDRYISELMGELSNYGDAVSSEVDRQNAFQDQYKTMMNDIGTMDAASVQSAFAALEESLKHTYKDITEAGTDLPEALRELLTKQVESL